MWIVVLWQPVDAYHDEFVSWFSKEFAPGMLESPELLRMRIFKLDNASTVKDQKHEQQNTKPMYQYMTFWEFDCDDLPWEILLYLGGSERWRYYVEGGHLVSFEARCKCVARTLTRICAEMANQPILGRQNLS